MTKGHLLFILSLFLVMVSFYFLTSHDGILNPKITYGDNSFMEDIVIEQKKAGSLNWRLEAKKAIHITNDDIKLDNIAIILPGKDLKINAETAYYNLKTKDFKIPNEVSVYAKDYEIKGAGIYWDSNTNTLKSQKDIKIIGKGFTLEGNSLIATKDKAMLEHNVKAVFYGN